MIFQYRCLRYIQMKPLTKFIGKHLRRSLLLTKLQVSSLKQTPAQNFPCTFLQILKELIFFLFFFTKQLWMTTYVDSIQIILRLTFESYLQGLIKSRKSVFFGLLLFVISNKWELYENKSTWDISMPCTTSNSGKAS